MSTFIKILKKPIASAVIAILCGFCVAAVVLAAAGYNPGVAFAELFRGALGRSNYISNVIIKATPLLFCGIAISFAYKAGLFNIGAEGQYILGTVLAVMVGSQINLPAPLQIPIVLLAGAVGGALIGALIGWLKSKFGIHEVITSIMCNWIALYFCNFIVSTDTFHRANSTGSIPVNSSSFTMILPEWKLSEEGIATLSGIGSWLKDALVRTDVNVGFLIAIVAAVFVGWLISRTKVGYEIRAVGLNRDAAKFAGISVGKNIVLCMVISGALCGLGGALTITGTSPHAISTIAAFENNGFNGLSVAFIAGCSPVGCIPASLLFSGLLYGGQTVQQTLGAPSEIINIMIGTIVFFMALGGIVPAFAERLERRRELAAEQAHAARAGNAAEVAGEATGVVDEAVGVAPAVEIACQDDATSAGEGSVGKASAPPEKGAGGGTGEKVPDGAAGVSGEMTGEAPGAPDASEPGMEPDAVTDGKESDHA